MAVLAASLPSAVRIGPLDTRIGEVSCSVHPDKAICQRAAILAALADGTSRITGVAACRDVIANLTALSELGVVMHHDRPGEVRVEGVDGRELRYRGPSLDAQNSATTARLLLAVLAGGDSVCSITGNALLRRRPMRWLVGPLRDMGADVRYESSVGRLPIGVVGRRLHGGEITVTVDSAQAVSALLIAGTLATGPLVIRRRTRARDHTERLLRWAGIAVTESEHEVRVEPGRPRAFDLRVPGDPSAAALLAALHVASLRSGSRLRIPDVCINPRRIGFFRILSTMGVEVTIEEQSADDAPEPIGTISLHLPGRLHGTRVKGAELIQSAIDELPLVAVLAAIAEGETWIHDASELRDKDTDRIDATVRLLQAFGVTAFALDDGLVVTNGPLRPPARLRVPPDHRIIFAALVLAVAAGGGTIVEGVEAAAVSHPGALEDLRKFAGIEPAQ
ncbi:MAG: 3-phosphoshikimate 1-carboxyvinyltransferase [Solirubrobacteraceae bacterium]